MQHRIRHTAVAIALGLGSLAAFASTADKLAATQAAKMDLGQAITAAQSQHGLKVIEAEIDLKKKQPVFEFKGLNAQNQEQKLTFSGLDAAQVVENKTDGAADKKYLDRLAGAKISMHDAIAAALKHTSGKAVEADLNDHLGTITYDVKVLDANNKEVKLRVNAADGSVSTRF